MTLHQKGIIKRWQKLGRKVHHVLRYQEIYITHLLPQQQSQLVINTLLLALCFMEEKILNYRNIFMLLGNKSIYKIIEK